MQLRLRRAAAFVSSPIHLFKLRRFTVKINVKYKYDTGQQRLGVQGVSKKWPTKTFWNIFISVVFLREIFQICWQFIPTYICQFLYIYLNISSNGIHFSMSTHRFHGVKFWVLNADASWARTWWESHHFQLHPDNGWKLSTVKKVCAVCRFKTIFPLVDPTRL